jgi:squalene monooxygenase
MPNGFLPASMYRRPGAFILGDAWNMRHPLTGGGMTVGLKDVCLLKIFLSPDRVGSLHDKDTVMNQLNSFYWKRKSYASAINILAQSLYGLFGGANHSHLLVLREACFHYFKLGGRCVSDPVGLLAGLSPSPSLLYIHFFLVALYGIFMLLSGKILLIRSRSYGIFLIDYPLRATMDSFRVLFTAFHVIWPYILTERHT